MFFITLINKGSCNQTADNGLSHIIWYQETSQSLVTIYDSLTRPSSKLPKNCITKEFENSTFLPPSNPEKSSPGRNVGRIAGAAVRAAEYARVVGAEAREIIAFPAARLDAAAAGRHRFGRARAANANRAGLALGARCHVDLRYPLQGRVEAAIPVVQGQIGHGHLGHWRQQDAHRPRHTEQQHIYIYIYTHMQQRRCRVRNIAALSISENRKFP